MENKSVREIILENNWQELSPTEIVALINAPKTVLVERMIGIGTVLKYIGPEVDAADPVWNSATFTARYAVIYDNTATNKDLVLLIDFGADKSPSNGDFSIVFNAAGVFTLA